jgi:hypothetical protein
MKAIDDFNGKFGIGGVGDVFNNLSQDIFKLICDVVKRGKFP